MSHQTYRVIFAAGGTGGHLFPAQALAEQLLNQKPEAELLFVGAKLTENIHFDKSKFPFRDISSSTLSKRNILTVFKGIGVLIKGVRSSLTLIEEQKPDLVIGFGSFHAFPILCAAVIKKIPLILFESNSIPGKVVKLFSRKALFTAIYLKEARRHLKGKTVEVEIPVKKIKSQALSQSAARELLGLKSDLPTLLVFGGSQGAKQINRHIIEMLPLLQKEIMFQLIHLTGNEETANEVTLLCQALGISCFAKTFESRMDILWSSADIAICRSGAMTLSELLDYEVPAILIPYPFAADQHQTVNAQFLEKTVGGAIHYPEKAVTSALLVEALKSLAHSNSAERLKMKDAMKAFKAKQQKQDLGNLVVKVLEAEPKK